MKFLSLGVSLFLSVLAVAQTLPAPTVQPASEMQVWLANLDSSWKETFAREVTAPFETEMTKLGQQYMAAMEANLARAAKEGNLDATIAWRTEKDRFSASHDAPAEDEATAPVALKQLRASWRTQATKFEKERAERAKAVLSRYDVVLAQAQKQLTQAQRIDDALMLKAKRAEVAGRWSPATPAEADPVKAAVAEPSKPLPVPAPPAATPAGTARGKLSARELAGKLLAAGADVRIYNLPQGDARRTIKTADEAPEKCAIFEVNFRPRPDGTPVTDADVALVESIPTLENLSLTDIAVTDAGLAALHGLKALKNLRLTKLEQVTGPGYEVLADLPAIELIYFENLPAGDAAIQGAAGSKRPASLQVRGMPVSETALAALGANTSFVSVLFRQRTTDLTPAGLAHLARMRHLTELAFDDFPVDDAMAEQIGKIAGLERLFIAKSSLTEAGVVSLAPLSKLIDLRLISPPATPGTIAAYKKMRALKYLYVGKQMPPEEMKVLQAALKGVAVKAER